MSGGAASPAGFACRSCGASPAVPILDLGRTPLANALLKAEDLDRPEPTWPLELVFCPRCGLVQITETVPPEALFRDYLYYSSYSDTAVARARDLAQRTVATRRLGGDALVIEIASNDGYLLQHYRTAGIPVLGIEPAEAIARVAETQRAIPTLTEFFTIDLAARLAAEGRRADVIHANNVLAHVPDLNGFVAGLRLLLKPGGMALIEVPYLRELVEKCEFDTIYHEHLSYFSVTALDRLFRRHELDLSAVERIPIHGGSLRLHVQAAPGPGGTAVRAGPMPVPSWPRAADLIAEEARLGMDRLPYYTDFRDRVAALRTSLVGLLRDLRARGHRIAAYGAAAKGTTLLAFCGIGAETLDFVVDRSPIKQGRYTPGTRLPILPLEALLERRPDEVLLLTWNFAEEILAQQAEYRRRGGRFIIPIPEPRLA